ncbi:MAG: META domain-containing protein [Actinomycetota bacterium]
MVRVLISLLCALSLVSCGQPSEPGPGAQQPSEPSSIEGGWRLVDGRGPGGEIPKGEEIDITLDIEGSNASGRSACNSYFGEITDTGQEFRFGGLGSTEMACPGPRMEAEALYMEALGRVDSRRMEGEVLVLFGDDTELLFKRIPPQPTAQLTDTQWQLEGLISGTGDEATVSSVEPATLVLHADGRLTGSTGCRELVGEWVERPSHIATPELGAEGDCPAALQEQDGHVIGVIGDGFVAEIDGTSLTISDPDGTNGLLYRAE